MEIISATKIDFVGKARLFGAISALAMLASAVGIFWPGFRYGTDFAGGTAVEVRIGETSREVDEGALRGAITGLGFESATITRVSDPTNPVSRRDFIYLVLILSAFGKARWFLALTAVGAPMPFVVLLVIAAGERRARGVAHE